jgi:putative DNA primase/helicase
MASLKEQTEQAVAKLAQLDRHRAKPRLASGAGAQSPAQAPEFSDDALALEFVRRGASKYRCSHGLGWMNDDGVIWSPDNGLTRYTLARTVCREAASSASEAEGKRIASAKTVNAVLLLAGTDARIVIPAQEWDAESMLLNTPGGMVDLRTGTLAPRGVRYVTQAARVAPAAAPCPVWSRFMEEVFLGDKALIEFMRRALGYCFTGDRLEQVVFFWYGLGANGKSVLAEFLQWLLGTYAVKLSAATLMQSKGERHPTELAQLRGKRLALSSELEEGSFFNESLLKELTGDPTLSARFMRQDFFEFAMTQKHVIVGNYKPRLRGGDPAMARRMLLVPFMATFKGSQRDPHMLDKLKAEAPAILQWIVAGAQAWACEGLAVPESVRAASAEYMADHDDLALWAEECCEREGAGKAGDLYASFSMWKKGRGEHAPSMTAWGSRLSSMPGIEKAKSGVIVYRGLRLTYAAQEALNASRR